MTTQVRVSAVLLAAGQSQRMGSANKLLLAIDGEPLVRRTLRTLVQVPLTEVVVVLGHQAAAVGAALSDLPARLVVNPMFADGQGTSVVAGMRALRAEVDAIMVCLADQPALTVADVAALIAAFAARPGGSIVVPMYAGQRGNPVIFAAHHREEVLAGTRVLGCRRLLERYPELVHSFVVDHPRYVTDIDTPEDYARATDGAPAFQGRG